MLKILAIGDPHFKVSNLQDARKFITVIKGLVENLNPDAVVILGDLLDSFEKMHSLVSAEICNLFNGILSVNKNIHIYYVLGNHDMVNNQVYLTDDHAFLPFKKWDRLSIVDRPISACINGIMLGFIPYVPNGRFHDAFAVLGRNETRVVFCHQEFKNSKMNSIVSKNGDEWPIAGPMVISGHIHERQQPQANILYVGSPFSHAYDETGEKTVSLISIGDTIDIKHVPTGMPTRLTMTCTIDQLRAVEIPDNCYIRVYLTGTTEEVNNFKKTKEYKELVKKIKIIPDPTDITTVKNNNKGLDFINLLKELSEGESQAVKDILYEVVSANKA